MEQQKQTEQIAIGGMSCGSCVSHVRKALEQVEGVEVCHVEIGSAEISYDPGQVDRAAIVEAVEDQGYTIV